MDPGRFMSVVLVIVGIGALAVAAAADIGVEVAIAFAVLGTSMVCAGAFMPILEGRIAIGPRGFEAEVHQRSAEVLRVARDNPDPEVRKTLQEVVGYIDPTFGERLGDVPIIEIDPSPRRLRTGPVEGSVADELDSWHAGVDEFPRLDPPIADDVLRLRFDESSESPPDADNPPFG